MGQAEDMGSRDLHQISMPMSNLPRDLLQKLIPGNHFPRKFEEPRGDTEELELSLGLSLNGRFGVDPLRAKHLTRSSSISDFANPGSDKDTAFVVPMACVPLMRTCSLPTETEEWRKRKELQMLRRLEAKRKRSVKQRNSKAGKDRNRDMCVEESCEEDRRPESGDRNCQKEQCVKALKELSRSLPPSLGFSGGGGARGLELNDGKGIGLDRGALEEVPLPPPLSQVSNGSQGSGSSGISESESQPTLARTDKCVEARTPTSAGSSPESEQPPVYNEKTISGKSVTQNQSNKSTDGDNGAKEIVKNVLEGMPSVSTKGDGPNGKRIEGFLYGYRTGEEVRIVCVCHGNFLTPAEFVKHAGGGDVEHPLKHIVVNLTPFL